VLYELLTGQVPFKGSKHEVLRRIADEELLPRHPRELDDAIPDELARICWKAMSKRIDQRYASAMDMAADLRAFLDYGMWLRSACLFGPCFTRGPLRTRFSAPMVAWS